MPTLEGQGWEKDDESLHCYHMHNNIREGTGTLCSKICLVNIYPRGHTEKKRKLCALLTKATCHLPGKPSLICSVFKRIPFHVI